MKRFGLLFATTLVLALAPAAHAVTFHNFAGLEVLSAKQLDQRMLTLTLKTSALPGPADIRILLPNGYAAHPHSRYPVLYLLHGTSGGASDWTTMGGAEQTTAGKQLIVVMPDIALNDDGGGWCTNWPDGRYKWETFHIDQLIPWVDSNLRTIAARRGRAIAGLSQGGFCSTSYAARHPDLFSIALGYSGAPDIAYDADARLGAMAIINATEVGLDRVAPDSMFGNPVTNEINWSAHDPTTLAGNLRWTKLYMYFGNGMPGPYDSSPVNPGASSIEGAVWRDNIDFHNRLVALGIPSYYDPYGNGTHSWPYWARDLRWSIGPIMADFAHPAPIPTAFTYASGDDTYAVYGWRVTMHRAAREFSTLRAAGRQGLTLSGSGSGTVLTPALYAAAAQYRVTMSGNGFSRVLTVAAGHDRRLEIQVPLGPSNTRQEFMIGDSGVGTNVYTTHVTIVRVR